MTVKRPWLLCAGLIGIATIASFVFPQAPGLIGAAVAISIFLLYLKPRDRSADGIALDNNDRFQRRLYDLSHPRSDGPIPQPPAPTVVYPPQRRKAVLVVVIALLFLAGCAWTINLAWDGELRRRGRPPAEEPQIVYILMIAGCGATFANFAASGVRHLFARHGLIIDDRGLSYIHGFRRRRIAWTDVSPFSIYEYDRTEIIVFDQPKRRDLFAAFNRKITRHSNSIPIALDAPAGPACYKLNAYRQRALQLTSPEDASSSATVVNS